MASLNPFQEYKDQNSENIQKIRESLVHRNISPEQAGKFVAAIGGEERETGEFLNANKAPAFVSWNSLRGYKPVDRIAILTGIFLLEKKKNAGELGAYNFDQKKLLQMTLFVRNGEKKDLTDEDKKFFQEVKDIVSTIDAAQRKLSESEEARKAALKALQERINELEHQLEAAKKETQKFAGYYLENEVQKTELQKRINEELQPEMARLAAELANLRTQFEEVEGERDFNAETIKTFTETVEKFEKDWKEFQESEAKIRQELEALKTDRDQANQRADTAEDLHQSAGERITELEIKIAELTQRATNAEYSLKDYEKTKGEKAELEREIDGRLKPAIAQLSEQLAALKETFENAEEADDGEIVDVDALTEKAEQLEVALAALQEKEKELIAGIAAEKAARTAVEEAYKVLDGEQAQKLSGAHSAGVEEGREVERPRIEQLTTDVAELTDMNRKGEAEKGQLEADLETWKKEVFTLKPELEAGAAKVTALEEEITRNREEITRLGEANAGNAENTTKITELTGRNTSLITELENAQKATLDLQKEVRVREEEIAATQREIEKLEEAQYPAAILERQRDQALVDVQEAEAAREKAQTDLDQRNKELLELEMNLSRENVRVATLESEIATKDKQIAKNAAEIARLKEGKTDNPESAAKIAELTASNKSLSKELEDTEREMKKLEEKVKDAQRELKVITGRMTAELEAAQQEIGRLKEYERTARELRIQKEKELEALKDGLPKAIRQARQDGHAEGRVEGRAEGIKTGAAERAKLEMRLNDSQTANATLQERLTAAETRATDAEENLRNAQSVLAEKNATIQSNTEEIERLRGAINSLNTTISQLKTQIAELEKRPSPSDTTDRPPPVPDAYWKGEAEKLKTELEKLTQEKEKTESEMNQRIEDLKIFIREAKEKEASINRELARVKSLLEDEQRKNATSSEGEDSQLRTEVNRLQEEMGRIVEERNRIEQELAEAQKWLEATNTVTEKMTKERDEAVGTVLGLAEENHELSAGVAALEDAKRWAEAILAGLKTGELDERNKTIIEMLMKGLEQFEIQVKKAEEAAKEYEAEWTRARQELEVVNREKAGLEEQIASMTANKENTETLKKGLHAAKEKIENFQKRMRNMEERSKELQTENARLAAEKARLEKEVRKVARQKGRAITESEQEAQLRKAAVTAENRTGRKLRRSQNTNAVLENDLEAMKAAAEKIANTPPEYQRTETEYQELRAGLANMTRRVNSALQQLEAKERELRTAQNDFRRKGEAAEGKAQEGANPEELRTLHQRLNETMTALETAKKTIFCSEVMKELIKDAERRGIKRSSDKDMETAINIALDPAQGKKYFGQKPDWDSGTDIDLMTDHIIAAGLSNQK